MYSDFWLILSQMEDYSIFSARGKISIFVQQYFYECNAIFELAVITFFSVCYTISYFFSRSNITGN